MIRYASPAWPWLTLSLLSFALLVPRYPAAADELKIAVAANFADALTKLAVDFEKQYGHKLVPVSGSTGKFYLQIKNGAPFEVFLAADAKHPRLLESTGLAVAGSRFTYAVGKIVLWSPRDKFVDPLGKVLYGPDFQFLAIANPEVAPYGHAAREYLTATGLWEKLQGRIVMGQDIGQTYHFLNSGAAELGFIALSQISAPDRHPTGSRYLIPQKFYAPLIQEAILVKDTRAAWDFRRFLQSPPAKKKIRTFGYDTP